jgi:hypothetical protein
MSIMLSLFSVINKKVEKIECNCKCNQASIVGFGDNDYTIREVMRFTR